MIAGPSFREDVFNHANRPDLIEAVRVVYAELQTAIEERQPLCQISGRCCRFEEYGHRLFITTLEMAVLVSEAGFGEKFSEFSAGWDGKGCAFQKGKLCGLHAIRPFGCRIFFCDPTASEWQSEQYERFHQRIKDLHRQFGVPYAYVEWRSALKSIELAR